MNLDIGDKVIFTNSVRCVQTDKDGFINEYGPIPDNKYIYIGGGCFKNVDQPHHTIKWYMDGRFFNGTRVAASYEIVFVKNSSP
jgi:hypothetical protein